MALEDTFRVLGLSQAFATRRHVNWIDRWKKYEYECAMLIIVRWQAGWLLWCTCRWHGYLSVLHWTQERVGSIIFELKISSWTVWCRRSRTGALWTRYHCSCCVGMNVVPTMSLFSSLTQSTDQPWMRPQEEWEVIKVNFPTRNYQEELTTVSKQANYWCAYNFSGVVSDKEKKDIRTNCKIFHFHFISGRKKFWRTEYTPAVFMAFRNLWNICLSLWAA